MLLAQYLIAASKEWLLRHLDNLAAVLGVRLDHERISTSSHSSGLLVLKEDSFIVFIDDDKPFIHLIQELLPQCLRLREEKARSSHNYMSYEDCNEQPACHD